MKNLDAIFESRKKFAEKMMAAAREDKPEDLAQALTDFGSELQDIILQEAEKAIPSYDAAVLAQRGIRQLTSEEKAYYQKIADAMRSDAPQQALTGLDAILPKTTIDAVFDEITVAHPLLNEINFQNTSAVTEWILSTATGASAWGALTAAVTAELGTNFTTIDLTQKKLSAFIPVAKAMLDLGPEWLDRYVRTILAEQLAAGLEAAIVDGDGNNKPIGMTRNLTGDTGGVFPRKTPVPVSSFDPVTIGSILNTISQGNNGVRRAVPELLVLVNPSDYFTKVFPATTVRATDGSYNNNVMPYPAKIIQSAAVPSGRAVFGLAGKYFFGLGTSRGGKLEYSDEYRFLEDQRVYLIKLYGNGRALDANAFVLADISALQPTLLQVEVISEPTPEA